MTNNKMLVIGSSNTNLIVKVKSFPKAGETVEEEAYIQSMGGKGANQAVAAHRLGGEVSFITCLGDDANGQDTLQHYKKEGLDISSSLIVEGVSSVTAIYRISRKKYDQQKNKSFRNVRYYKSNKKNKSLFIIN